MALHELTLLLDLWPGSKIEVNPADPDCYRRLTRLLQDRKEQRTVGVGDLAAAVRHVLCYENAAGPAVTIRVPQDDGWPDEKVWDQYGISAQVGADGRYLVSARDWQANWLEGQSPFADAFAWVQKRGPDDGLAMDPCVVDQLPNYSRYLTIGQQALVRAVFNLAPGRTLLGLLPTGTGKSLAVWAPALLGESGGTTLVAVPTTALALDQERQVRKMLKEMGRRIPLGTRFAFHSGMTIEERQGVRDRIRGGEQPIVFTHPLNILGGLSPALYDGRVSLFVIDEAHLVAEWGHEFCPEYQALAGFRRDLLRQSETPFPTLLLTATLTEEGYRTLATLFRNESGPVLDIAAELKLRAEPSYWACHAVTREEQESMVLEAVRHGPRPLILYSSTPDDVGAWHRFLKEELRGERIGCCHGGTAGKERLVEQWMGDEVDIMVANSAFGVGMDKTDVRAVIHACVPETIDRYYQEVGRGGRDGRASTSIVVWTDEDRVCAEALSRQKLITVERGMVRWREMHYHAVELEFGTLQVDLRRTPPDLPGDSRQNRAWNLRTLALMARSGLIARDSRFWDRPTRRADEPDREYAGRCAASFGQHRNHAVVEVLLDNSLDRELWNQRVEPERQMTRASSVDSFGNVMAVLEGRECISSILCQAYRLDSAGVFPTPTQCQCVRCRAQKPPCNDAISPTVTCACRGDTRFSEGLRDRLRLGPGSVLYVKYDPNSTILNRQFVRYVCLPLVQAGVRGIVCRTKEWMQIPDFLRLYRRGRPPFLMVSDLLPGLQEHIGVPWLSLVLPGDAEYMDQVQVARNGFDVEVPVVVIAPREIQCSATDERRFFELCTGALSIKDLQRRLRS